MAHPPAFCPEHLVFPATLYTFVEVSDFIFSGAIQLCPKCRRQCEVIPGVYNTDIHGRLNVLVDPSVSVDILTKLRAIAEQVQSGDLTDDEAEKKASELTPKAAGLFDKLAQMPTSTKNIFIGGIIAALGYIISSGIGAVGDVTSAKIQADATRDVAEISRDGKSDRLHSDRPRPAPHGTDAQSQTPSSDVAPQPTIVDMRENLPAVPFLRFYSAEREVKRVVAFNLNTGGATCLKGVGTDLGTVNDVLTRKTAEQCQLTRIELDHTASPTIRSAFDELVKKAKDESSPIEFVYPSP